MSARRPGPSVRVPATSLRDGARSQRTEEVATEEPLEIRLLFRGDDRSLGITMRTPGNDFELAVGFLHGEGVIRSRNDVERVQYCVGEAEQQFNMVSVALRPSASVDLDRLSRITYRSSACGVCGTAALEALEIDGAPALPSGPSVVPEALVSMPDALRSAQRLFARTGGVHAAGLFSPSGELILAREDVGRHNAVDKLVGSLLLSGGVPVGEVVLVVSGRASYEILQKALAAGIPFVAAVGAPSSLAVDVAGRFGMTLAGFVRDGGFNVYAGPSRVSLAASRSSGVSTSSSASGDAT